MNTIVPSQDAAIFAGPLPTFGAFEHYGCTECAHHVIAPSELHDVDYCPKCEGELVWFKRSYPGEAA